MGSGPGVLRHKHVELAATALAEVLRGQRSADSILHDLLRANPAAGARDRRAIGDLLYGVLRSYFPLRAALGESPTPLELCAAHALRTGLALPALRELDVEGLRQRLAHAAAPGDAASVNLDEPLWQRLRAQYGAQARALAQALNEPAPVDLRVNTLKATRDAAREALAAEGIEATPTPQSPVGLRLARRAPLPATRAFREGWVEPQDEGSQRLAQFVAPHPGERVADYCAGAGGKTLALGALMQDRGALWALDASGARLARLQPRLARSGLTIVHAATLPARDLPRDFDAVLVDAPCSATGTLRRNPELRLRRPDLAALARLQGEILAAAAALVRAGGRLIYATCSVLREENEAVVADFLARHARWKPEAELVLLPHRDGTDGFYAARLRAP